MLREKVKTLSYPSEVENKLKDILNQKNKYHNIYNVYLYLTSKNKLIQEVYKINNITFNNILLKNYILSKNSTSPKVDILEFNKSEQHILNQFNNYINDNSFYKAIDLIENNIVVFNYLCLSYIRNLNETNNSLIDKIPDNRLNQVYNKLLVLNQIEIDTNNFNREKKYRLIFK